MCGSTLRMRVSNLIALGLLFAAANASYAETWRLGVGVMTSKGGGAKITQVIDPSPAKDAGLKKGDIIVSIDGDLINDAKQVREKVLAADDTIKIIYLDGPVFMEVTADLVVISYEDPDTGKMKKRLAATGNGGKGKPTRRAVSDPRPKN